MKRTLAAQAADTYVLALEALRGGAPAVIEARG